MDIKTKVNKVKECVIRHKKEILIGTGTFIGGVLLGSLRSSEYRELCRTLKLDDCEFRKMLNYVADSDAEYGVMNYGNGGPKLLDLGTSVIGLTSSNITENTEVKAALLFMK